MARPGLPPGSLSVPCAGEHRRSEGGPSARTGSPPRSPGGAAVKVATFSIRASMPQSVAWKKAADSEGFSSVGSWAACALDAYLKLRAKAGLPLPLAWHLGRFAVCLED